MLDVRGVGKSFGQVDALTDVSFFLDKGEVAALLGENGAGKSTLLRVVAGLERADRGSCRVAHLDLTEDASAARRSLGFLGHEPGLYDDLTAEENIRFAASFHLSREDLAARVRDALAAARCGESASERTGALSRGMRQRVAIARTIVHRPRILVLDEPFAGLDADSARTVERLLVDHGASGGAALVATHDPARARAFATRVLVLAGGRLVRDDRPPAPPEAYVRSEGGSE